MRPDLNDYQDKPHKRQLREFIDQYEADWNKWADEKEKELATANKALEDQQHGYWLP